jgi:hypothetical protein
MLRSAKAALSTLVVVAALLPVGGPVRAELPNQAPTTAQAGGKERAVLTGTAEHRDENFGTGLTECPQAGLEGTRPQPLDRRAPDQVERIARSARPVAGRDKRMNQDFACGPQDEVSIGVNPRNQRNLVGGANDYRLGWGTSGFYASTDGGDSWYDGIMPFPSLPNGDNLDGGGDPGIAFDRSGVVYYSEINFNRTDDTNGVFVMRSTNGGFTWNRPCVPITGANPGDDVAVCGGAGDPRQPGDGVVVFQLENINTPPAPDFSVTFHDKVYMTAGPRPAGVGAVCFAPETKTAIPAGQPGCPLDVIGVDRLYVTWTAFNNPSGLPGQTVSATIELSYSDDQGRSFSPRQTISGSAPFCAFGVTPNACDNNQFSVPAVHPSTGRLAVSFQNFNTADENQYLVVTSTDGGATFGPPSFVSPVFDVNFPRAGAAGGRPDCTARGQGNNRIVYTNTCFRSNAGGNVTFDPRGGSFADDLYLVLSDNRNGTRGSSNADVFLFKSVDGGATWVGPTRVNNDRSDLGGTPRDSTTVADFGNDQWWPWVAVGNDGWVNIAFKDRRLDTASTASEWPTSRQRPGNYLVWTWAAQCRVTASSGTPGGQCVSAQAAPIPQPTEPIDPGPDPVPGQGQTSLPFRNFQVSDVPSNFDYTFRAGIFAGDYDAITISRGTTYVMFTDARNGRSSRNEPGRNPLCEQSDAWLSAFRADNGGSGGSAGNITPFLVTPCTPSTVEAQGF